MPFLVGLGFRALGFVVSGFNFHVSLIFCICFSCLQLTLFILSFLSMCVVEIMGVIYWLLELFTMNQAFSKKRGEYKTQ